MSSFDVTPLPGSRLPAGPDTPVKTEKSDPSQGPSAPLQSPGPLESRALPGPASGPRPRGPGIVELRRGLARPMPQAATRTQDVRQLQAITFSFTAAAQQADLAMAKVPGPPPRQPAAAPPARDAGRILTLADPAQRERVRGMQVAMLRGLHYLAGPAPVVTGGPVTIGLATGAAVEQIRGVVHYVADMAGRHAATRGWFDKQDRDLARSDAAASADRRGPAQARAWPSGAA
jgi:hypothetical protein